MPDTGEGGSTRVPATVEVPCSARRTKCGSSTGSPASARAADGRASTGSTQKFPTTPIGLKGQLRTNREEVAIVVLLNPKEL